MLVVWEALVQESCFSALNVMSLSWCVWWCHSQRCSVIGWFCCPSWSRARWLQSTSTKRARTPQRAADGQTNCHPLKSRYSTHTLTHTLCDGQLMSLSWTVTFPQCCFLYSTFYQLRSNKKLETRNIEHKSVTAIVALHRYYHNKQL